MAQNLEPRGLNQLHLLILLLLLLLLIVEIDSVILSPKILEPRIACSLQIAEGLLLRSFAFLGLAELQIVLA